MTETADQDWMYQRIVEDSPIAILYADRDGKIRFWNAGAEAMFGYPAQEALGQSLDLIVPEKQRARHWEGWTRVMATGITKYGSDPLAVPASVAALDSYYQQVRPGLSACAEATFAAVARRRLSEVEGVCVHDPGGPSRCRRPPAVVFTTCAR